MASKFEEILSTWLNYPPGTIITDQTAINEFINAALEWDGKEFDLVDSFKMVMTEHTQKKQFVEKICRDMRAKIGLGCSPKTHSDYVDAFCKKWNVKYTLDRQLTLSGEEVDDRDVFNKMFLLTAQLGIFTGKDYLTAAWQDYKSRCQIENERQFYGRIAYNPAASADGWVRVVETICADNDPGVQSLAAAVLMSSVWRVKAKLARLPTRQHIMTYLRSKQGSGKSEFMEWLLGPVAEGTMNATFEMFDHDEKMYVMKNSPIIFFDEVAKADKADAAKVKNLMTAKTAMLRKLYGEATKGRLISTFFGAGNFDLVEVFNDPTGLRRFFQIEVRKDLFKHLGQLFAEVDPVELWQSVNEHQPCPTETPEIVERLILNEVRTPTPVEEWLVEVIDKGVDCSNHEGANIWYDRFVVWKEKLFPHDKINYNAFCSQLARLLKDGEFPHHKKLNEKTRRAGYIIGANSPEEAAGIIDQRLREAATMRFSKPATVTSLADAKAAFAKG